MPGLSPGNLTGLCLLQSGVSHSSPTCVNLESPLLCHQIRTGSLTCIKYMSLTSLWHLLYSVLMDSQGLAAICVLHSTQHLVALDKEYQIIVEIKHEKDIHWVIYSISSATSALVPRGPFSKALSCSRPTFYCSWTTKSSSKKKAQ